MASVVIGGKEYTIPELNFVALERAWPYIEESMVTVDPMRGASTGIHIIAAGLVEAPGFQASEFHVPVDLAPTEDQIHAHVVTFLKKKLRASELKNIAPCIDQIIKEAGFNEEEGEDKAATDNPSTETSPDTSSSSSPPELKAEAGTE